MRAALIAAALLLACGERSEPAREPEVEVEVEHGVEVEHEGDVEPEVEPEVDVEAAAPEAVAPAPAADLVARYAAAPPTLDALLDEPAWGEAARVSVTTDYAGNAVSSPTTNVRLAWTEDALVVAFECSFEPPLTAPDAPTTPEYAHLYGYDVVEVFLDADPSTPSTYREIELGPRGHTLDVAVDLSARPHGDVDWSSGVTHAERVDDTAHTFTIEARIPASALGLPRLAPADLRVGLFRITGRGPAPRLFLARFPTRTARPNFHVPERFGLLRLAPAHTSGP